MTDSTQTSTIATGDAFISLIDLTDLDEAGAERQTPAGSTWVVSDINENGEGPGTPNYCLISDSSGASIYASAAELLDDFNRVQSPHSAEHTRPRQTP